MSGTQLTATQQKNTIATLKDAVSKQKDLLVAMGISELVFNRLLLNMLVRTPDLARCTQPSLYEAVYKACETGLVPDGKHAAIVALNRKGVLTAEFWPMVDGRLLLVRRNLEGVSIQAHNAHEQDEFEDVRGSVPCLMHRVTANGDRTEATLIASYATAHFKDNLIPEIVIIYVDELKTFKKNNKGPWSTHPLEMYKVRALNRLIKRLPISAGLSATLASFDEDALDEDAIETTATEIPKADPPKDPTATSGTKAAPKAEPKAPPKATAGKKTEPKASTTGTKSPVEDALF